MSMQYPHVLHQRVDVDVSLDKKKLTGCGLVRAVHLQPLWNAAVCAVCAVCAPLP